MSYARPPVSLPQAHWDPASNCTACEYGYWGSECLFECQGGACQPCNNNGRCLAATGTCECSGNYTGAACTLCQPHYGGPQCQYYCPTDSAGAVCAGHGTCNDGINVAVPSCTCDQGLGTGFWAGAACGDCAATGFGSDCALCPGSGNCHGHGTCSSGLAGSGACACDAGYWGPDCAQDCPGVGAGGNGLACFGHGTCGAADGACACYANATHGTWSAVQQCADCVAGYWGPQCTGRCLVDGAGAVCSGHGACAGGTAGDGACACASGYWESACGATCPATDPATGVFCGGHASGCRQTDGRCVCHENGVDGYWQLDGGSPPLCSTCLTGWAGQGCTLSCTGFWARLVCVNPQEVCDAACLAAERLAGCAFGAHPHAAFCAAEGIVACANRTRYGPGCAQECPGVRSLGAVLVPCSGHGWCHGGPSPAAAQVCPALRGG